MIETEDDKNHPFQVVRQTKLASMSETFLLVA